MRARTAVPLGADFWKLWTSTAVTNLGDGITMVAGPLLVASLSTNPAAVAGAVFAQQLPWLLFALLSGAWSDRVDRRRLVVAVDLVRAAALAVLAAAALTGTTSIPLIYVVFFVLGTGETLADTAAAAFVPTLVPPSGRPRANAWMYAAFTVLNQFTAKPVGAWLFVAGAALPFGVNAMTFALAAVLLTTIRSVGTPGPRPPSRLSTDVADGIRWLVRHRLLRTLAVTMAAGNLVFCAAFAVFVLYAQQRLGVTGVGYGVLLLAFAVGGLAGTLVAPTLARRFRPSVLLRAGLLVEVALHATLAWTTTAPVAAAMIVVFGVHTTVWGIVVTTIRQRDVPPDRYGRVAGVYAFLDLGGAALGSLLGGLVATVFGLVATYGAAAVAMTVVTVLAWRPIRATAAGSLSGPPD